MLDETGKILINASKHVELKPYIARTPLPVELMSDKEIQDGAGGTLFVDTETYFNYHLIAFRDLQTKKVIKFEINDLTGECFNERKLSWVMHSYRTVGFNSIKYDLPIIWFAYGWQNCKEIKHISDEIIFQNTFPAQIAKDRGFTIHETNHIDLIEVCPLRGSLKLYGGRLHATRIQDLPFNVHEAINAEQIEIVANYCINDLETTELLFNNLKEQLELRESLTIEYHKDVRSKSDAQIAETVIGTELKKLTGVWPKKPEIETDNVHQYQVPDTLFFQTDTMKFLLESISNTQFTLDGVGRLIVPDKLKGQRIKLGYSIYRMGIGGLHSSEETTAIKSNNEYQIYDRDVASYYPAIVLNTKLYPKHLGEAFLNVYQGIVDRRIAAKKAKNIAVSENLKVTINGTFGKTGSPYSFLYAPEMTVQITVGGQLYLLMLIEMLELFGISVYSANTDGIVIYCHKDQKQTYLDIIKWWEQATGFVTEETEYEAVYSRDVNAYMAIKKDGSVKGKNLYYDPWRAKTARDSYWRFQKNPTAQICIEAIENLIVKNISIDKTITECTDITKFVAVKNVKGGAHKDREYLGKVVRWAYFKNENGTINYILNGNKVPDTDGARPLMDLPTSFPDDINYDWYINRATEMLYDIGYLKRVEQLKFF